MSPVLKHFSDISDMNERATNIIAARLQADVRTTGAASLMVSGGSTPGPIYEQLSHFDLSWDKITIGLVDDRWVDETDTGSNAALIRRTLLKNKAANALFQPMKTTHDNPDDGQIEVEALYSTIKQPYSVIILGMGTDGHTASWFPGSKGLEPAIDPNTTKIVQAVTAKPSEVTGAYLQRMTMTRHAIGNCHLALLLITGEKKQTVLQSALKGENLPIRQAIEALGDRLMVLSGT